jgi:hypothetical protein
MLARITLMNFTPVACFFLALAALALMLKELFIVGIAQYDLMRARAEAEKARKEAETAEVHLMIAKMQIEHCEHSVGEEES